MSTRPARRRRAEAARGPGPAGDLRQEEDLAVGADRLEEGVLVDLAVDGHGHTLLEVTLDARVQGGELLEQLLHGRRGKLELRDTPRELREVADQDDSRHLPGDPRHGPCTGSARRVPGDPRRASISHHLKP
jgi:hypothetical protein